MKTVLLTLVILLHLCVNAQLNSGAMKSRHTDGEKYFSFNPFALAEPQLAAGIGFGNRCSERSEYFSELSYLAKQPFYNRPEKNVHGIRFIAQYRYHFLQQWRPLINWGGNSRERKARFDPFAGVEFRIKPFSFTSNNTFIRNSTADTLNKFLYNAGAVVIGGAIILGETCSLTANGKWKLEVTAGIGGKVKTVRYKNLPAGYEPLTQKGGFGFAVPSLDKEVGMPYFPCAIRLRYTID